MAKTRLEPFQLSPHRVMKRAITEIGSIFIFLIKNMHLIVEFSSGHHLFSADVRGQLKNTLKSANNGAPVSTGVPHCASPSGAFGGHGGGHAPTPKKVAPTMPLDRRSHPLTHPPATSRSRRQTRRAGSCLSSHPVANSGASNTGLRARRRSSASVVIPNVSLKEARRRRDEAGQKLAMGTDPGAEKKAAEAQAAPFGSVGRGLLNPLAAPPG